MEIFKNIIMPILSVITGGVLVLIGQFFSDWRTNYANKKKSKIEALTNCRLIELQIRNLLKELAYYKVRANYWHLVSRKYNEDNPEASFYKLHFDSLSKIREIENKIGELNASFFSNIQKFGLLASIKYVEIDEVYKRINSQEFKSPREYDIKEGIKNVRENLWYKDSDELRKDYMNSLKDYDEIIKFLSNKV